MSQADDEIVARYMERLERSIEEDIRGVDTGAEPVGLLGSRPQEQFGCFTRTNTAFDKHLQALDLNTLYMLATEKHVEAKNELLRRYLNYRCAQYIDATKARLQIKSIYHVPFIYPLLSSVQLIEAGSPSV